MNHYCLFAGEVSGDLHGAHLVHALRDKHPLSHFSGVGGPRMRAAGLECFLTTEDFQVMGFSDVFRHLPSLVRQFYAFRNYILHLQPTCVILIDYPGFNLRLAKSLRKKGYTGKIVQYICPSVWAHGASRIQTMADTLDLLLTIYPFESAYFAPTSLSVRYVGNPLVETLRTHPYNRQWAEAVKLPTDKEIVALFPGSRRGEIMRHLPLQLTLAAHLQLSHPQVHFALSCAHPDLMPLLQTCLKDSKLQIEQNLTIVPPNYRYELMQRCHTAIAKSGTVTLELALHKTPTLVIYNVSSFNYLIAKYILRLKLPYYCIVNILGKGEIFPERIGRSFNISECAAKLQQLHSDQPERQFIDKACTQIKHLLGSHPTHKVAAEAIIELSS